MDITSQHPWHALLLTPLSAEQTANALPEDDPRWEYIDGQMVKLGSLAHSTLNLEEIQRQLIGMLAETSKDFRLMVHLLRTLQHGGNPEQLLLAVSLLTCYVQQFWSVAWPQSPVHKRRFAQQILKRFDSASEGFNQLATDEQRESMQDFLARLAQVWHDDEADLAQPLDGLRICYARLPKRMLQPAASDPQQAPLSAPSVSTTAPVLTVDNSSDKAWRQTLLKMADILCDLQPDTAIGFRLRRHAVWGQLRHCQERKVTGAPP